MSQAPPDARITVLDLAGGVPENMNARTALQAEVLVPDYIREGRWVACPMAMGEERWLPAKIMQIGGENSPDPSSVFLSLGWWNQASVFPLDRVFSSEADTRIWIAETKAADNEKMYLAERADHRKTRRQLIAMKALLDAFDIPHE